MMLQPFPPELQSHPHPQFVAAKSLMLFPPEIFFTLSVYAGRHVRISQEIMK